MRAGDHPIGPGIKRPPGPFLNQIGNAARFDQGGIKVGAVKRGQDRDCQYFHPRSAHAISGGLYHMRIAMHRQEIMPERRQPTHRRFDRGADVEQLHIQKNPLAVLVLQLIGQRQPAAGQHAQPDLVKVDRIAQGFGQTQALQRIRQIKGKDQAVVRHGRTPLLFGASCGAFGVKSSKGLACYSKSVSIARWA